MPLPVSVIVTNFNHAQYVDQALDSMKAQSYPKDLLEIIFIDDGSTDNSKAVVNAWIEKNPGVVSKTIWMPENKGKWNILNTAISQASGKLITIQDADDVSCPDRISRQVQTMEGTKAFHVLCGFYHCFSQNEIDAHKNFTTTGQMSVMMPPEVTALVHKGRQTPGINHYYTGPFEVHSGCCLFYKQHWENGMRFLPGSMGLRCQKGEDSDFNTKMTLLLQKTAILLEKHYCYRRNSGTGTDNLNGL